MFVISFLRICRKGIQNLKLLLIKKDICSKVTLVGDNHEFSLTSRVTVKEGSHKEDIILEDHVQMSGDIVSINHGKVIMHEWSKIGENCTIISVNLVEIGKDTAIANGVTIVDNNFHPINPSDRRYMRHTPHGSKERSCAQSVNSPVIIGENVWIGTGARICKGVKIGDNSVIAACSVVTKDVPANAIAAGNPAKIVKTDIDKITTPKFPL